LIRFFREKSINFKSKKVKSYLTFLRIFRIAQEYCKKVKSYLTFLMPLKAEHAPEWDLLMELAGTQQGHFSLAQARELGFSRPLLFHHVKSGRLERVMRGVYRLKHFPRGENDELVALWLFTECEGIFSHETALALHGLSDVLPARVHLWLPRRWRQRPTLPPQVARYFWKDVRPASEWFGVVQVTTPLQTLADCVRAHILPELLTQAIAQAQSRGLITETEAASLIGGR